MEAPKPIRMLLVGAGRAGHLFLRLFQPHEGVVITAVVDRDPNAPGLAAARERGLPTGPSPLPFLEDRSLDLIVNVTGSAALQELLAQRKPPETELLGGSAALLIWTLLREYEEKAALEGRFELIERELARHKENAFLVGNDPRMLELSRQIAQVAPTPTPVLILGETGTGKEVIARAIHQNSPSRHRPLVSVNCTAFSPTLIESELFGYVKGAFTGAATDRPGLLEIADGGAVFLDEVGDMPLEMQAKLLRFLQEGEIRPVGSHVTKKVQARVIAATNRNLQQAVEAGAFRADLFYRLNTFTLHVPPLRERRSDIPLYAYHFLEKAQAKVNKRVSLIAASALATLQAYDWPGNLRELANVIERAVVLCEGDKIEVRHLPLGLQPEHAGGAFDEETLEKGLAALKTKMIEQFERDALSRYLAEYGGNITRAAEAAKISRRTFHRLLKKHGVSAQSFSPRHT
ncbi:sigma 54-interacting transcriptional regulator [Rhodocaloribacter sp.]